YRYKRAEGISPEEIMKTIKMSSRDHARTPMQWNSGRYSGFSTNEPWIQVNPNYRWLNAEAQQKDPLSVYHFYKKMISLRKKSAVLIYGIYNLFETSNPCIYAYTRENEDEKMLILANLKGQSCRWKVPEGAELLLGNYSMEDQEKVHPFEARVDRLAE